ncbi:hypothetical protein SISSUDRAFT_1062748 [Sistotremastrum suecicum HHB10207 ss-3]|uniref:F-box domain-containing protein n=1 Tax=Sistotremastrum suecicum HHB10207 ss-3 TaxID=1314776 RepID=A0A166CIJ5_9AGAM|nr:hypothetical protein SISSUDRAFT_1062748 [Sistotremastrum suecicum HHB10207 ss-3]
MDASYNYRQNDGITRLPVEIWREILLFATALSSPWDSLSDLIFDSNPKPGDDIFGWFDRSSNTVRRQAWWSSWQTKVAVVLTCTTWHDIGEAMLYENIRDISKNHAPENIQDLLAPEWPSLSHNDSEPLIPLRKAHLVQRMDLWEERALPKLLSIALHCVNLNELRFATGYITEPESWQQLYRTFASLTNLKVLIVHTLGQTAPESSAKVILPRVKVLGLHTFRAISILAHWQLPSLRSLSLTCLDIEEMGAVFELHGHRLLSLSLAVMLCPGSYALPIHTWCPLLKFFSCLRRYAFETFPILLSEHPSLQTLGMFSLHSLIDARAGPGMKLEANNSDRPREKLPKELQNLTRAQFPCLRVIRALRNSSLPISPGELAENVYLDASVREHCRNEGLSIQDVWGEPLELVPT